MRYAAKIMVLFFLALLVLDSKCPGPSPEPPPPVPVDPEEEAKIFLNVTKYEVPSTPFAPPGDPGALGEASDVAVAGNALFVMINGKVFRSDDNGAHFARLGVAQEASQLRAAVHGSDTWVGAYTAQHLFSTNWQLHLSVDGGATFVSFDATRGLDGKVYGVAFAVNHIYVATSEGLKRRAYGSDLSQDDFEEIPNPTDDPVLEELNSVAIDGVHADGNELYVMSHNEDTDELTAYISTDHGVTFTKFEDDTPVDRGGEMATSTNYIWFATGYESVVRFDRITFQNGNLSFNVPAPANPKWRHIKAVGTVVVAQSGADLDEPNSTGSIIVSEDEAGAAFHPQGLLDGRELPTSTILSLHGFGLSATHIYLRPKQGWLYVADVASLKPAERVGFSIVSGYADLTLKYPTDFYSLHVDASGIYAASNDGIFFWKEGQQPAQQLFRSNRARSVIVQNDTLYVSTLEMSQFPRAAWALALGAEQSISVLTYRPTPGEYWVKTQIMGENLFYSSSSGKFGFSSIQDDKSLSEPTEIPIPNSGLIYDIHQSDETLFVASKNGVSLIRESEPNPIGPKPIDPLNVGSEINDVQTIFALGDLVLAAGNQARTLYVSENAGDNFQPSTGLLSDKDYLISSISGNERLIYVVLRWVGLNPQPSHLYRSTDKGKTFEIERVEGLAETDRNFHLVQVFNDKVYLAGIGYIAVQSN